VKRQKPVELALSVALAPHLPRLRAMIRTIRDALGDALADTLGDALPRIIVGRRPFLDDPTLATRVGADVTAKPRPTQCGSSASKSTRCDD
jgi:hypothetical protein